MASPFHKRYVPPPKEPKIKEQTAKRDAQVPPGGSDHVPKHLKKTRDPNVELSKKLKRGKILVNRPLPKEVSTNIPVVSSSPPLETAGKPAEIDIAPSEENQTVERHGLTPIPQPIQSEEGPRISISSALPDWLRAPTVASNSVETPFETFSKEGSMSERLVSNLSKRKYSNANGLQSALLPMLLPEHRGSERYPGDICISAATGSGKTLAYALPLVEALSSKAVTRLRGLIVVPTRELVTQARETLELCSAGMGVKIGTAVGNKKLKDEQHLLVEKGQRLDPDAYRAEQQKEIDEDEELMNWDFDAVLAPQDGFECWPDHIIEYSSKVDILICTPGRLVEHIKCTKGFHLHHIQWLVIDEADRLLAESFQEWVDVVIPTLEFLPPLDVLEQVFYKSFHIPRQREVLKIVLSATMTRDVSKLLSLRLRRPRLVILEGLKERDGINGREREEILQDETVELPSMLQEVAMAVGEAEDKPLYLLQLLNGTLPTKVDQQDIKKGGEWKQQRSDDESDASSDASGTVGQEYKTRSSGILIFANSNESALRLARLLTIMLPEQRIKALTKSPSGKDGRKTLRMFRRSELSVIVATDLASRGLDIPDLAHVINYDLPTSLKSYVHRVGRTARAGKAGMATTLLEHRQARWFWNDIGRTKSIIRATRVARIDQELRVGEHERTRYVDALSSLEQDVMGKDMQEGTAEVKRDI